MCVCARMHVCVCVCKNKGTRTKWGRTTVGRQQGGSHPLDYSCELLKSSPFPRSRTESEPQSLSVKAKRLSGTASTITWVQRLVSRLFSVGPLRALGSFKGFISRLRDMTSVGPPTLLLKLPSCSRVSLERVSLLPREPSKSLLREARRSLRKPGPHPQRPTGRRSMRRHVSRDI